VLEIFNLDDNTSAFSFKDKLMAGQSFYLHFGGRQFPILKIPGMDRIIAGILVDYQQPNGTHNYCQLIAVFSSDFSTLDGYFN
jgi:hypothetical protein